MAPWLAARGFTMHGVKDWTLSIPALSHQQFAGLANVDTADTEPEHILDLLN
jgi:hypothetical protein